EKALLQEAAVIGKLFWLAAVADRDRRQAEERLHALERKEFVQRARRSSIAGETEYSFAHVLVRDVAYAQIPRAERAEKRPGAAPSRRGARGRAPRRGARGPARGRRARDGCRGGRAPGRGLVAAREPGKRVCAHRTCPAARRRGTRQHGEGAGAGVDGSVS